MKRYWEIDSARGIAIALMIAYHFFFDLRFFGFVEFGVPQYYWRLSAAFIASLFLLIVGVSLSISFARAKTKLREKGLLKKYLARGIKIFALGLLITAVTWIYPHNGFIVFGILHLIGLSIILSIPLLGLKKTNLLIGLIIVLLGLVLQGFYFGFPWLLWLGFMPYGFYTLDYYPLLPWFGLVLIGLFFGKTLYPDGKRAFNIPNLGRIIPMKILLFLGRNSLLIYLLHQPVIAALLFLFFGFPN